MNKNVLLLPRGKGTLHDKYYQQICHKCEAIRSGTTVDLHSFYGRTVGWLKCGSNLVDYNLVS